MVPFSERAGRLECLECRKAKLVLKGAVWNWGLLLAAAAIYVAQRDGPAYDAEHAGQRVQPSMVRTDQTSYEVRAGPPPTVGIAATITNTSKRAVYLPTGGSALLALERQVQGRWETALRPIRTAELREPAKVRPGEAIRDTALLDLRYGVSPPISPGEVSGTYRAVYAIFAVWDSIRLGNAPAELLARSQRTSNVFTLRLASEPRR